MDDRTLLIIFIVVVLAAVFLFIFMRRDRGKEPVDRLPEVLHEPLDGRSGDSPSAVAPAEATVVEAAPAPTIPPAPGGSPDDLSRMKGVGPKLIALLNELGITHYSQIAALNDAEAAALDEHLGA